MNPTRKSNSNTSNNKSNSWWGWSKKNYLPVPYNMRFELSIMTKLNDDMLQIIEQILPYFQPAYQLPINF